MYLNMIFRKSTTEDIPAIMEIVRDAQEALQNLGINQWQNGYPSVSVIETDIAGGNSYVLFRDGEIVATAAVLFSGEPTYADIHNGAWITDDDYAVVHRLAVKRQYKQAGTASFLIDNIEDMVIDYGMRSIRIDTHEGNIPMRGLLQKKGYKVCGIIYLADGNQRVALEKVLGE